LARTSRPLRFFVPVLLAVVVRLAGAESDAPRLIGPFDKAEYPQALIDRPLTLPAGMVEGELGGTFRSFRFEEPGSVSNGIDDWDADVALRVGVTDRIQLEAATAFSLDHTIRSGRGFEGIGDLDTRASLTSWRRVVPFRLSFLALDTETLDTALTLTLPFVAHASRTIFFGRGGRARLTNSDGRVLPQIDLGAPTRWRLTDWLWLRAGEDLFAVSTGHGIAQFRFNLGLGVQPHHLFAVTLDSRIASIAFDGDGHEASQTVTDVGTIELAGVFAPCRYFDLVGMLALPDVGRGFDDYAIRTAIRVRL
jgi:hypothetical protein